MSGEEDNDGDVNENFQNGGNIVDEVPYGIEDPEHHPNENIGDEVLDQQPEHHPHGNIVDEVPNRIDQDPEHHPNDAVDEAPYGLGIEELEHHAYVNKPKCCRRGFVIFHVIAISILVLLVLLMIVYASIPASPMSTIAIHSSIIVLPQPNYPLWLVRRFRIETDGPCTGEVYYMPCSEVVINYTENYDPPRPDFIYCMGNSSFIFTQQTPEAAEGFVTNDYNQISHFDDENHVNCSDPSPQVECVHFDPSKNQSKKYVTLDLPWNVGNYYFIRRSSFAILYSINRYSIHYHDKYKTFLKGKIVDGKSLYLSIQKALFIPWTLNSTGQQSCLLLNTTRATCYGSSSLYQNVIVNAEKRYDILLWPVILFLAVLVIESFVSLGQWLNYHARMIDYNNALLRDIAS